MSFAVAEKIADAVFYEGYLLYPYRPSALKNQLRWQFGVLMPRGYGEQNAEPWVMQSECLIEPREPTRIDLRMRFLTLEDRRVEQATGEDNFIPVSQLRHLDRTIIPSEEGIAQERDFLELDLAALLTAPQEFIIEIAAERAIEPLSDDYRRTVGRVIRERFPITAAVRISGQPLRSLIKLRTQIENRTVGARFIAPDLRGDAQHPYPNLPPSRGKGSDSDQYFDCNRAPERSVALRQALIATHMMFSAHGGGFFSLTDPPEWARAAAASCVNLHCWPVLIGARGARDVVLAAPIILEDYPAIAPQSPADMFDGTEIDELLILRTLTLSDDEKAEAKASDARAAAIIERVDNMPLEALAQLHGAVRPAADVEVPCADQAAPWWTPEADSSVSPETDSMEINGITIAKGSIVCLRPRPGADAQDMFLAGRPATVQALLHDVDGRTHIAVTLADDPAAELNQWYGRHYYFYPDELEPLSESIITSDQEKEKQL